MSRLSNETTNQANVGDSKKYMDDEDDAFWSIVLMQHDDASSRTAAYVDKKNDSDNDNDNDAHSNNNNNTDMMRNNVISYLLPIMSTSFWYHDDDDNNDAPKATSTSISLHLSPLPCSQGIFSPLGAQAWYGSALLSALLLQQIPYYSPQLQQQDDDGDDSKTRQPRRHMNSNNNMACRRIQEHLAQFDKNKPITALELGSGAVGLAGLSLACMLACMPRNNNKDDSSSSREQQQQHHQQHRVILTDHETCIVQHLKRNVEANQARLQQQLFGMGALLPQVHVETLDWNDLAARGSISHPLISLLEKRREADNSSTDDDDAHDDDHDDDNGNGATDTNDSTIPGEARQPNDNSDDHTDALQLLVGSELVYTTETARACAQCVMFLLERYPRLLVLIIQVIHRDGWSHFLTLLRNEKNILIHEECIPVDCDTMAREMIPAGGTLDRFDFGACYIYRSDATAFL